MEERKPSSAKLSVLNTRSSSSSKQIYNSRIGEKNNMFLLRKKDKTHPTNMADRETLYEENIKIKLEFNQMLDELKKLKSANQHLEKDIQRYESILEEGIKFKKTKKGSKAQQETSNDPLNLQLSVEKTHDDEGLLIITQKKQIKELHKEIAEKNAQIEKLKKDVRISKLQECQMELKYYQEECERLRTIYLSKMEQEYQIFLCSQMQQGIKNQDMALVYKNDNIALSTMLRKIEADFNNLKSKYKDLEQDYQKVCHKKVITEKLLQDKEGELVKMKEEQQYNGKKMNKEMERQMIEQIENKNKEIYHLTTMNEQLSSKVQGLEKKVKDMTIEFQVQQTQDGKEKQTLSRQNADLRRKNDELNSRIQQLKETIQINGFQQDDAVEIYVADQIQVSSPKKKTMIQSQKFGAQRKRVAKVNNYDVEDIGGEIKIRLKLQGIGFNQIDNYLTPGKDDESQIKIHELAQTLQQLPFKVEREESAILVSRYLIEENQDDWLIYDENKSNNVNIVKCVFKNLIKPYDLLKSDEVKQLYTECSAIFLKYRGGMTDAIKQMISKKGLEPDFCEFEDLMGSFRFCDVTITRKQQDYLKLKCYEQTQHLTQVNYRKLFDYLDGKHTPVLEESPTDQYLLDKFESPTFDSSKPQSSYNYDSSDQVIQN